MTKFTREQIRNFIDAVVENRALAELLLDEHPDLLNARWIHHATVLHYLAAESFSDAVQFLAEKGAKINAKNKYGDTALMDVCNLGNDKIAAILLNHRADVNFVSETLETPIICAVRSGNARLVELLLRAGADPTYRTPFGKTIFDVLPSQNKQRLSIYRVLEKYAVAAHKQQ